MLTQERLKELLDYDTATGVFVRRVSRGKAKAGNIAGYTHHEGYVLISIDGRKRLAHRLAWLYTYGYWPTSQLDHINRVRDDNRIENLREVTDQENHWNRGKQKNNSSGLTGVFWDKKSKKWRAYIYVCGKQKHLGLFDTQEEASVAYLKAKAEHHIIGE